MGILVALIVLSILILIHELGHFLVAKAVGIKVLEFSIFMGPKLFSVKRGETVYSLRLIPMGGFVKMEGEDEASDDIRSFSRQPLWKRALVIGSGPAMNIMLAFLLAAIVLSSVGYTTNRVSYLGENSPLKDAGMEVGDRLISYAGKRLFEPGSDIGIFLYGEDGSPKEIVYKDADTGERITRVITPARTRTIWRLGFTAVSENGAGTNEIQMIEDDSPLRAAGIRRGDIVVKIDEFPVSSTSDIQKVLNETRPDKEAPLTLEILRNGQIHVFENIKPYPYSQFTLDLGFERQKGNFFGTIGAAWRFSVSTIRNVFVTLGWLFNGTVSFRELSGPVGIIGSVGSVVQERQPVSEKVLSLLYLSAFIGINLGVMNLLPIPALDGSILLILLIEKIRGKPLPQEKVGMISLIGFMLLIGLLIATLFNDIPRWFF
ncbi:MAG: RIP metalloprotease RseP [Clostridiaceae bacterium]|jgi:regulator of sigma E protease|nr:RIP metalloprotease RseP [Clostridiaceae bacterium]